MLFPEIVGRPKGTPVLSPGAQSLFVATVQGKILKVMITRVKAWDVTAYTAYSDYDKLWQPMACREASLCWGG